MQRIQRKEDYRFLTGTGVYTDDAALPNQTYAAFVRSPHAHAKIKTINADAAKRHKGVLAVYTGEDLATAKVGGLPCGWLITDVNGKPMKEPPYPPLAQGKVRHVGERVAVVIAEALEQARDAAESIEVDYDVLACRGRGAARRAPRRQSTISRRTTPATSGRWGTRTPSTLLLPRRRMSPSSSS